MLETQVWTLGRAEPLEKEMATHFSILAWRIPWTEEPGRLQSVGSQRVRHNEQLLLFSIPFIGNTHWGGNESLNFFSPLHCYFSIVYFWTHVWSLILCVILAVLRDTQRAGKTFFQGVSKSVWKKLAVTQQIGKEDAFTSTCGQCACTKSLSRTKRQS